MTDDLTRARLARSGQAKDSTPRIALEDALEVADEYEYCVVILGRVNPDGAAETRQFRATPSPFVALGLLWAAGDL